MREIDIIDVCGVPAVPSEPRRYPIEAAWEDLCCVVADQTGINLRHKHPYSIFIKDVAGSGGMKMIVACPKNITDPAIMMEQGFISPFGNLSPPMWESISRVEDGGARLLLAMPMASAVKSA